jgi:hypothetical protein
MRKVRLKGSGTYLIERVNVDSSYDYYMETGHEKFVNLSLYLEIVYGFIKFIMAKVFDGYDVELSGGRSLGSIGIRGRKIKPRVDKETGDIIGIAPSWSETFKLWKEKPESKEQGVIRYCFNEHSNGIKYKLVWWKSGIDVKHAELYKLKFSRRNTRKVWEMIHAGKEYLTIE